MKSKNSWLQSNNSCSCPPDFALSYNIAHMPCLCWLDDCWTLLLTVVLSQILSWPLLPFLSAIPSRLHLKCDTMSAASTFVSPTLLSSSSVQALSRVPPFATPGTAARQASLSITNSWSLLKLTSIESVMPSNHLILCCPLLLPPLIFPSIRVFSSHYQMLILSCLSVNILNGFDFPNVFPMILSSCFYNFAKTQLPNSQSWFISTASCILPHCFLKLFSELYQTEVFSLFVFLSSILEW